MGPFIKDKDSEFKLKLRLLLSLIPFIIFSIYKNGFIPFHNKECDVKGLIYPLVFIVIIMLLSFVFEVIYYLVFKRKNFKRHLKLYNPIDSLLLGLMLPINTNLYLLVLATFILSSLRVMSMRLKIGINPLVISYLVISIFSYNYYNDSLIYLVLCILSFIYLTVTDTIKYKITLSYLLTIFIISYVIGTFFNYSILYSISFIVNTIFLSIYVITDVDSTCVTGIGQIFEGIFIAILTIIFMSFNIDGLLSVVIVTFLINILDYIGALSKFNIMKSLPLFIIAWICIISTCLFITVINKNFDNKIMNKVLENVDYK